jgi:hypothetical protein
MPTLDQIHREILERRAMTARLTAARLQCAQAETERLAAMADAHQAGWSVRAIADALGVPKSSVHRLLQDAVPSRTS